MTWHATYTLCHPFLFIFISFIWFNDTACNPHTVSSISFYFYFLHLVWWHSMQPICCVINFFLSLFPSFGLMTWCATHMLCCQFIFIFISFILFDDAVCNPHTMSSILFLSFCVMMWCATHTLCHLFYFLHFVWWHGMQLTCCVIDFILCMLRFYLKCIRLQSIILFLFFIIWMI